MISLAAIERFLMYTCICISCLGRTWTRIEFGIIIIACSILLSTADAGRLRRWNLSKIISRIWILKCGISLRTEVGEYSVSITRLESMEASNPNFAALRETLKRN